MLKAQKALDEAGIEYSSSSNRCSGWNRTDLTQRTGQRRLPAIEFDGGTIVREESDELVARIRDGRLMAP